MAEDSVYDEEIRRRLRDRYSEEPKLKRRRFTFQDDQLKLAQYPVNPKVLSLQIPGRNASIHIERETARELIHVLRHFVRTGRLGIDSFDDAYFVGGYVKGVGEGVKGVFGQITDLGPGMISVQDIDCPGPTGNWVMLGYDTLEQDWEPCDPPSNAPTWHERLVND